MPNLPVFWENQPNKIFFWKSGSVSFEPLWCHNFMQKSKKIVRAVFQVWRSPPNQPTNQRDRFYRTIALRRGGPKGFSNWTSSLNQGPFWSTQGIKDTLYTSLPNSKNVSVHQVDLIHFKCLWHLLNAQDVLLSIKHILVVRLFWSHAEIISRTIFERSW